LLKKFLIKGGLIINKDIPAKITPQYCLRFWFLWYYRIVSLLFVCRAKIHYKP